MEEKELEKILRETGFTEGELKVYLALLKIGESKVGIIIKKSGISRSKVYDILEKLILKSIVSKVEKGGILFYQVLPPNSLLNIIKQKEKNLKKKEELFKKIIPKLMKIRPKDNVNVSIYEGYEGFKAMIDRTIDELKSNDIYEAMGISKTTSGMRYYARKIYEVQKKKKFKARSIFDETGAVKMSERKTHWHKMKILPKGWYTPALFTIYKNTVGIHIGSDENIMSIVIKSSKIEKSFRSAFKAMWEIAK